MSNDEKLGVATILYGWEYQQHTGMNVTYYYVVDNRYTQYYATWLSQPSIRKGKKTYRFLLELQIYSFLLDFTGPSTYLNTLKHLKEFGGRRVKISWGWRERTINKLCFSNFSVQQQYVQPYLVALSKHCEKSGSGGQG